MTPTTIDPRSSMTKRTLERGEVLMTAGGRAKRAYRVLSGALLCRLQGRLGRTVITRVVDPGQWVGLESVSGDPARATLEAATRTVVETVDGNALSSELQEEIFAAAVREAAEFENRVRDLGVQPARMRAARVLLERSRPQADGQLVVSPPLSRQELAALAGMVPETFIRILSSFRTKGFVATAGQRIRIDNRERLANIAGQGGRRTAVPCREPAS